MAAIKPRVVRVEPLRLAHSFVHVIGESPLLMNRFCEKIAAQMLSKHMGEGSAGKKSAKDPQLDFVRALHLLQGDNGFGLPSVAFKAAAVRGAGITQMLKMTEARTAFRVDGNLVPVFGTPKIDVNVVRVFGGQPDVRIRPLFEEWACAVPVTFNEKVVSIDQIHQMFYAGGFGCGIGDWRQEKDGTFGAFRLASQSEVDAVRARNVKSTAAFFKTYASQVAVVQRERTSLWRLIEREAPEVQEPDEAKKLALPRAKKGNGAAVARS